MSRRLASLLVGAVLVAIASPALAGKPSSRAAVKAAKTWRTAMNAERSPAALDAAVALTGASFWMVFEPEDPPNECAAMAPGPLAEAAPIRTLLDCVLGGFFDDGSYGEPTWKVVSPAKVPKELRSYRKQLAELGKHHVLVLEALFIPSPATEWALYAVAKAPDGTLRVDAVLRAFRDETPMYVP